MKLLEIPSNSVIIVLDNLKKKLLKKLRDKPLKNIKIITINELRRKLYFDYDEQAIYYLMKKYSYLIDVAKMYMDRMYEVNINDSKVPKIKKIIDLKEELIKENLLTFSPNFREYLNDKTIVFYECNYLKKEDKKMLDDLANRYKTISINDDNIAYNPENIYEFRTIEEEVTYIASEICKLFNNGDLFNQIKLCGATGEYQSIIKRIFKWYNIPIVFDENYLYGTSMAQSFLGVIEKSGEEILEHLRTNFDLNNKNNLDIYNKIIAILNSYAWAESYLDVKSFIEEDLKSKTITTTHYQEEVEIIDSLSNACENNYVFLMGFNQGDIPKSNKDESYFNDTLKKELNLETTNELNQRLYEKWLKEINAIKNLIITYKLTSSLGEHYLSSLNDELKLSVVKPKISYNYSNIHNKLLLGEKIDTLIKYGDKVDDLELLFSNYKDLDYRKFNNEYSKIDPTKLKKYLKNKLVLSYSSMNSYYQCGFRYYLSNILKLNIFEETFYTILGNLFHYILSIAMKRDINLDEEYNTFISKCSYQFNSREKFFLSNLKKELEFIIDTIKKQAELTSLNKNYLEEKIEVNKSKNNFEIIFKGFVDKILVSDDEGVIAIIDYKTGNPDLNLNNIIYGLDLQLPVYVYLAKKKFPHAYIAGFYLQKILNNEISKDYKHTYLSLKEDKLKLQGYSNSNINILEQLDSSYNESKMIKGMRTTSKGLGTKKVLRDDQIDILSNIAEERIDEAIENIIDAKFDINPKRVGMNNLGCKYCEFKDICFFTEKNIKNLKEYKNMEFLGGDPGDTEETN